MSMFRRLVFYSSGALAALVLLFAISLVQVRLNDTIAEHKLTDADPVENVPPLVAFTTVALGSFRGLLADILWLRASAMQDDGNYFEMVQLASWITKLQPRFSGATAYLAWNMAYNISVTCSSFEDRWRWVQRGIELIRDEALLYNPNDPVLYKELGWIWQHKVGNIMDDANIYYKSQLAVSLTKIFGGPEPDWNTLAAAPKNEAEFKKAHPSGDRFWKALPDAGFESLQALVDAFRETGALPEKFIKALGDEQEAAKLDAYLRADWLRSAYKLDPSVIVRINAKYGKFDWRLPEPQAVYWAFVGLEKCRGNADIALDRMITQSLKECFMGGRLLMVDKDNFQSLITVPNMNLADAVRDNFLEAYRRNETESFRSALINFMKDAVVVMYNFGNYTKAKEYYEWLGKEEPHNKEYKIPLDNFVLREWTEDVTSASMKQANDIVTGLLYRSCYLLAYGDREAAAAHEKLARLTYARYQKDQSGALARTGLADFGKMKSTITQNCLKSFPPVLAKLLRNEIKEEQGGEKAGESAPETPKP